MLAYLSSTITEVYGFALDPRAVNTGILEMQTVATGVPGKLGPLPIHHVARQLDILIIEVGGHPVTSSGSSSQSFLERPRRDPEVIAWRLRGFLKRCLHDTQ